MVKTTLAVHSGHAFYRYSIERLQIVDGEDPVTYKSRWRSIRVMYFTMVVINLAFSITLSTIYPLLKILDPVEGVTYLGSAMAAYGVGQLISQPLFGIWSNVRARTREPMVVSLVINVAAYILYTYLESVHTHAVYILILARFLTGFGDGNAVLRSYIAGATTLEERTATFANASAFQAMGFVIGTLVQTAMVPIGFPGPVHSPLLHLDMYTATGFFGAFAGIINILLLIFVFKEHRIDDYVMSKSNNEDQVVKDDGTALLEKNCKLDYLAAIASMGFFFTTYIIFVAFETISSPLCMHMFSWTKTEATLYIGIVFGAWGVVALVTYIIVSKIPSKRCNERYILLAGFLFGFIGYFFYLPWGSKMPDIYMKGPSSLLNGTETHVNSTISSTVSETGTPTKTGCPSIYDWCFYTPALRLWQYIVGTLCFGIGFPLCQVMSFTLFSKILGPRPQGTWTGFLTAVGSLARLVGPEFVSQLYQAFGPRIPFISILVLILLTALGLILVFRRLVPFGTLKYGH